MKEWTGCERLTDGTLLAATRDLAARNREVSVEMLRHMAEVDKRKLYGEAGYRSMFHYCLYALRLSESEAGRRVAVARAGKGYVRIFGMLRRGELSLYTAAMVVPHLTPRNRRQLLALASRKSVRELDLILAELVGRREKPDRVLHIAASGSAAGDAARVLDPAALGLCENQPEAESQSIASGQARSGPLDSATLGATDAALPAEHPAPPLEVIAAAPEAQDSQITPPAARGTALASAGLAAAALGTVAPRRRVQIQLTADAELLQKLERAKELLRGRSVSGRYEHVLGVVLDAWLERNDPQRTMRREPRASKRMVTPGKRAGSGKRCRRIPRAVKVRVFKRDGGQCTFRNKEGQRCDAMTNLEFDHKVPFARGGRSDNPRNIRLLCHAHNRTVAIRAFGWKWIERAITRKRVAVLGP